MTDSIGTWTETYGLTTDQLEQLRQQYAERNTGENRHRMERTVQGDTVEISNEAQNMFASRAPESGGKTGDKPEGKGTPGGSGAGKAAVAGAAQGGSSDSSDKITELKQEIQALQQEIQELQAKSAGDPDAAEKVKTKQMELEIKQSELTQLQSQGTAGA